MLLSSNWFLYHQQGGFIDSSGCMCVCVFSIVLSASQRQICGSLTARVQDAKMYMSVSFLTFYDPVLTVCFILLLFPLPCTFCVLANLLMLFLEADWV